MSEIIGATLYPPESHELEFILWVHFHREDSLQVNMFCVERNRKEVLRKVKLLEKRLNENPRGG